MSVRPYRDAKNPTRPAHHWLITVALGKDPATQKYRRAEALICPASCTKGCSKYPDLRARTEADAKRVKRTLKDRLLAEIQAQDEKVANQSESFGALLDRWIERRAADTGSRKLAPRTLEVYQDTIRLHLKPALGDRPANEITTPELYRHFEDLTLKLSGSSVRQVITIANQAYKWAVLRGELSFNPVAGIQRPKQEKPNIEPPPVELVEAFLGYVSDSKRAPWLHKFLSLAFDTGQRRGELCGIQWRDVDFVAGTLYVAKGVVYVRPAPGEPKQLMVTDTKTHNRKHIGLDPSTLSMLAEMKNAELDLQREALPGLDDVPGDWFVFHDEDYPGLPMHPDRVTQAVSRAAEQFQAKHPELMGPNSRIWTHGFRHLVASILYATENPVEVAELLGHSSTKVGLDTYGSVLGGGERTRSTVSAVRAYRQAAVR